MVASSKVVEATAQMAELKSKLQDKVAICIGEATARQFAFHGARAVVIADVQDQKGQNVAASIGPHCSYIHCDVSDEYQVKNLVDDSSSSIPNFDLELSPLCGPGSG